jgi:hypothetical protein
LEWPLPSAVQGEKDMAGFRVLPIDPALTEAVRNTLKSPQYGHPAHVERATGYGPCRACLKQFQTGKEDRILFTYNPFAGLDAYPSPGPVFIHAESCESYSDPEKFLQSCDLFPLPSKLMAKIAGSSLASAPRQMKLKHQSPDF